MLNYMYLIMQTESKEKARNTHADIMSHVSQYFGDMFKIIDFCSVTLSIDSIRSVTDFFFLFFLQWINKEFHILEILIETTNEKGWHAEYPC